MKRAGFTLLEAVVALTIVGTVAIGALEAYAVEARAAVRARQSAPAAALARERLSRLERLDAHLLRTLPESLSRGLFSAGPTSYEWAAAVRAVAGEPDLYELAVDVRWPDGALALRGRSYRPPLVMPLGGARP